MSTPGSMALSAELSALGVRSRNLMRMLLEVAVSSNWCLPSVREGGRGDNVGEW